MFDLENYLRINQKIREELTLQEKIRISNEENDNFDEKEKKEVEEIVKEYFNKHFNFEAIEKAKSEFRIYCRNEIRRKYAQRYLNLLIEKI